METNQPIRVFRSDRVSSAIWETETSIDGESNRTLCAAVRRRYRDQHGIWKRSHDFSWQEIPLVIDVLKETHAFMVDQGIQDEIEQAIEQARSMPLPRDVKRLVAEDGVL